jgi:hypothetical protein
VVVEMVEMTFLLASSSAASCNQMALFSVVRSLVHQQHIHWSPKCHLPAQQVNHLRVGQQASGHHYSAEAQELDF